jgi:hypothetical protein
LVSCSSGNAQQIDTLQSGSKISYGSKEIAESNITEIQVSSHSVKKATIMSTILPGLGQGYNKKYWKIPIIYIGLGTIGYSIDFAQTRYKDFQQAYIWRADTDETTIDNYDPNVENDFPKYTEAQLQQLRDYYRRNRDLSFIIATGIYILNIVDATVDAHFFSFDISNDLSIGIEPIIFQTEGNSLKGSGLSLTLKL